MDITCSSFLVLQKRRTPALNTDTVLYGRPCCCRSDGSCGMLCLALLLSFVVVQLGTVCRQPPPTLASTVLHLKLEARFEADMSSSA